MVNYLKSQGLKNPFRTRKLIHEAIESLNLNLEDLIVLTEAASRNYVVTPIIAAIAGAEKIYAITADSQYGQAKDVADFTNRFAEYCGVRNKVQVIFEKTKRIVNQADIITNLGFVRPINRELIDMMKEDAVIPLMCEAWELREGDIDLKVCRAKGIPVMATNEDYPGLEVFDFSGNLCIKMLFELEIEVYKSKIAVISSDKFGIVIEKYLKAAGAQTGKFKNLKNQECREFIKTCDALVIADYSSYETFIGNKGQITVCDLFELSPGISVVQFSGMVVVDELAEAGIPCFPRHSIGTRRMGMTLAHLGPKPVISLHTAGLKVGELMARERLSNRSREEAEMEALRDSICQELNKEHKYEAKWNKR